MKITVFRKAILIVLICFVILNSLTACANKTLNYEKIANHEKIVENSQYGKIDMAFKYLDGEDIRTFKAVEGKEYKFDYKFKVESGEIKIEFADSKGNIIDKLPDGEDVKQDNKNIHIGEIGGKLSVKSVDDELKIIITGKGAAGYIKINW